MINDNLFPQPELIDMKFLELAKFGHLQIDSRQDIDKALQELSFLHKKNLEIDDLFMKHRQQLDEKFQKYYEPIEEQVQMIRENIEEYLKGHIRDIWFESDIDDDDKSIARLKFDHGEIICKQISKTKFQIKTNSKGEK